MQQTPVECAAVLHILTGGKVSQLLEYTVFSNKCCQLTLEAIGCCKNGTNDQFVSKGCLIFYEVV